MDVIPAHVHLEIQWVSCDIFHSAVCTLTLNTVRNSFVKITSDTPQTGAEPVRLYLSMMLSICLRMS